MTEHGGKIGKTVQDSQPHWPEGPKRPKGAPNILVILFDDVGFSDLGCYGSLIETPAIDAIAKRGLRYTGFHTTAMCSTTRAALLTGRNHHSVGVGCLANFDSGYPGYRGKISREAGTIAEMLRPHGYRNYMLGKWHVTPLTESGATGPFDGWPLGRGFDRYYGFMDAETDQFAPELVRDNTPVDPPGTFATGYHLTSDLVDQAIRYLADHVADNAEIPWLTWVAFGACHAPHQAPFNLVSKYDSVFAEGWDAERERRLARQIEMGVVPKGTQLPPRNDSVRAWADIAEPERRMFTRLQAAYAAMLDHADQHIGRLMAFLESAGQLDDTMVIVMSDNGASQEGGPFGMINAMGPYNLRRESLEEKIARIEDIGGPDTHSNFPWGWAMAANTPLRRYKQNTHGGGIRDPLVMAWDKGIAARGELRHQFCHASDLVPTLLDVVGIKPPKVINGVKQMPLEGTSFAKSLKNAKAKSKAKPQYFEMFGHRGLVQDGWKAVSFHPPGADFANDKWELYHLDQDFNETNDLAEKEPERLKAMIEEWWRQAEASKVLPLDDRFAPRFADNAKRFHGPRNRFVFHAGMGHVPTDVAPDVRNRTYTIEADVQVDGPMTEGVLIAHGDATTGYSLYMKDGKLAYDMNIGGEHHLIVSDRPVPAGNRKLAVRMRRNQGRNQATLLIDGESAGSFDTQNGFVSFISWSGLDIGRDRSSPVSHYEAPFAFTGKLRKVTVLMDDDQVLDAEKAAAAALARE
ncbi:arylsulfatase [Reyranella sp.]|uniref:arylsulfatase n=1 Tax=Reyranella sp. TaxID=1929291 RepID=UPI002720A35F|nr:arylsulfatase [Reyranella sp.]MDO8972883.1 arylsulfatase [Reyranella sp.]